MALSIKNLRVRSLTVGEKEVTWEIGATLDDPLDYTFEVQRSESPGGPWDTISPPFEDRYIFIDRRVPLGEKYAVLYYRLRCTHRRTGAVIESDSAAQLAEVSRPALAIRRYEMVYFSQVVGRTCWLFKKRTFGPRCKNCVDPVMNKRTIDRCLDCFGTGMLRGYLDPIEVYIQIDPSPMTQQNAPQQIAQLVGTSARTSFYPNITPGDIIIEGENKRWRVQGVQTSELLRAPIKQEMTLRQIEEKDIEYQLPLRLDRALRDIHPTAPRLIDNATDIQTAMTERDPDTYIGYVGEPRLAAPVETCFALIDRHGAALDTEAERIIEQECDSTRRAGG